MPFTLKLFAGIERWRRIRGFACLAQALALVGFGFAFPFVPLYLPSLGISAHDAPLWAGALGFASMLPMALVSPLWGAVGDHYGRKPMVMRALVSGAATVGLLIVAPSVWALVAVYVLVGALTGVISPLQALVSGSVPPDKLGSSMGLMEATVFAGNAIGPLLGGFLIDRLGFHAVFALGAGLVALSAIIVLLFVSEDIERKTGHLSGPVHPFTEAREALAFPGMPALAAVFVLISLGNIVPSPVLPLLAPELAGVPVVAGRAQVGSVVGLTLAVTAAAGAVSSWHARRLTARFGNRRVLVMSVALAGLLCAPAALATSVWTLVLARAAAGFAFGAAVPVAGTLLGLVVPEERRGAAYGLKSSASALGFALGPLLGGSVGVLFGLRPVFLVGAAVLLGAAGVIFATVREARPAQAISAEAEPA